MPFIFKPVVTRKRGGKIVKQRTAFYWAEYVNADGQTKRTALKLPNGQGVTDRRVAEDALRKLVNKTERRGAGLIDLAIENAGLPFRSLLARFAWHLRAKRRTPYHITKTLRRVKWLAKMSGIELLAHVNEPNVTKALAILSGRKVAPKTLNDYRAGMNTLCTWAVRVAKLMDRNPVEVIPIQEINGDIRKVRRALTHDEAERLLAVSPSRSLWYETSLHTGLRVSEQKALKWQDMELEADRPAIFLRPETTKAKRADSIPLRADLAEKLKAARPPFARPTDRVFKNAPKGDTFHRDREKAGIPYADDRGRTVDLHALRTTYITWLSVADVSPRTAQECARHSDLKLTMRNYTDARLLDTFNAVERLPALRPENQTQTQRKTGTDDGEVVVVPVVVNMREGHGNAVNGESRDSALASLNVCDSSACASILNTSLCQKRESQGVHAPAPLHTAEAGHSSAVPSGRVRPLPFGSGSGTLPQDQPGATFVSREWSGLGKVGDDRARYHESS